MCAAASVAWPQRRVSRTGVNHRRDQTPSSRRRKNDVSERFSSDATACIQARSCSASSTRTPAGLPANGRSVKASTTKSGCIQPSSVHSLDLPDDRNSFPHLNAIWRAFGPIIGSLTPRIYRFWCAFWYANRNYAVIKQPKRGKLALNSEPGGFVHQLCQWHHGEGPLYARLAKAIRAGMVEGTIPVGSRLPAERVLADALAVSRTTVAGAYRLLEEEGWLERRRGSGTRVKLRSALRDVEAPTVPLSQGAAIEALLGELEGTVDLTVAGFSGANALPTGMLTISAEAAGGVLLGHVGYLPSGLPQLREGVAGWLTEQGLPTASPQVLITSGAQQAIGLVAALVLQPGDVVVLANPTYFCAP